VPFPLADTVEDETGEQRQQSTPPATIKLIPLCVVGARGFERSGHRQQRILAVLAGTPTGSSPIRASSAEPGYYEGVTG
jgi:hypothetical protein